MDVEKKQQILRQKQMMRKGEKNGSFVLGYCNKCLHCLRAFCLYYDNEWLLVLWLFNLLIFMILLDLNSSKDL